jgi:hypothetical protein
MENTSETSVPFPPTGWVTNREAARMLGVGLETMTCSNWKWRAMLRGTVGEHVNSTGFKPSPFDPAGLSPQSRACSSHVYKSSSS